MRLLKVVGDEFSLVQVPTHNNLPYAILSHTWSPGQEITLQELVSGSGKGKSGFEKIKFCGKQAMNDGLLYFWVDTCCIDKSDPAELTTAINSMFRWYRNASTWETAFRSSKWFTRGWTLQELIAPTSVEFYCKEGRQLGDKRSQEDLIHDITRIPIKALQGNSLSRFSITERKNWAAQRQTTQEEDLVYCLLGLCEVSMPAIYGEGKEAALKRFQMTVKGFSISSEPENLKHSDIHFIIPFDRNPNFTGRELQLTKLKEQLFKRGQTAKVAITGLGGIGKTQLVLELAYQIREKHENCSVIWIPATNHESLHQAYLGVASQLGIPGCEDEKADVERLVQEYLSRESAGQWLLVFDNADDVEMWITKSGSTSNSDRLLDYLPRSEQGAIIFTTRDRKTAGKLTGQKVVEVPQMDESTARQLLENCLVNRRLVEPLDDTTALLQQLTFLPLAIVQAAAYINANGIEIADYLLLLNDQEEEVIELLSEKFEDDGKYRGIKNPVATTWLISFEQIRRRDPLAAEFLSFMACVEPKDVPPSLLPPCQSQKKVLDAIGTLDAYSFIHRQPADSALDIHRLVHLAMRNWLREENLLAQWSERAVARLAEVFPSGDHQNRSIWKRYLTHAKYALESDLINKHGKYGVDLAWSFGRCLYSDGRWKEAEDLFMLVMETRKRVLGYEHPDTLTSMANLASTYSNQGRWKEAEDLEVLVTETSSRVLGYEHPSTLTYMANLASTYRNQGRWKEAEDLEVLVMKTMKRVLGHEHPHTLTCMANLAVTWKQQGRLQEALRLLEECATLQGQILGIEHPQTTSSTTTLTAWRAET